MHEGMEWADNCGLMCRTIADLSFFSWNAMIPWFFGDDYAAVEVEKNYPDYHAWNEKLAQRPAVKKVLKDKEAAVANH